MPKMVNSTKAEGKEEPKRRSARLSVKPDPVKVEGKPKKAAGKDKPSEKKYNQKEKGEQRENKLKWLTMKLKIYLQKMEKQKNEESPASDEAGGKESKSG